jgi:hypothetical protein
MIFVSQGSAPLHLPRSNPRHYPTAGVYAAGWEKTRSKRGSLRLVELLLKWLGFAGRVVRLGGGLRLGEAGESGGGW